MRRGLFYAQVLPCYDLRRVFMFLLFMRPEASSRVRLNSSRCYATPQYTAQNKIRITYDDALFYQVAPAAIGITSVFVCRVGAAHSSAGVLA